MTSPGLKSEVSEPRTPKRKGATGEPQDVKNASYPDSVALVQPPLSARKCPSPKKPAVPKQSRFGVPKNVLTPKPHKTQSSLATTPKPAGRQPLAPTSTSKAAPGRRPSSRSGTPENKTPPNQSPMPTNGKSPKRSGTPTRSSARLAALSPESEERNAAKAVEAMFASAKSASPAQKGDCVMDDDGFIYLAGEGPAKGSSSGTEAQRLKKKQHPAPASDLTKTPPLKKTPPRETPNSPSTTPSPVRLHVKSPWGVPGHDAMSEGDPNSKVYESSELFFLGSKSGDISSRNETNRRQRLAQRKVTQGLR